MEKLVFIGNVNKGLSLPDIRKGFHVPESLILIIGAPEGLEEKNIAQLSASLKWGVYLSAEDFASYQETIMAIEPRRIPKKILIAVLAVILGGLFFSFDWWQWLVCLTIVAVFTIRILWQERKLKKQLEVIIHDQEKRQLLQNRPE